MATSRERRQQKEVKDLGEKYKKYNVVGGDDFIKVEDDLTIHLGNFPFGVPHFEVNGKLAEGLGKTFSDELNISHGKYGEEFKFNKENGMLYVKFKTYSIADIRLTYMVENIFDLAYPSELDILIKEGNCLIFIKNAIEK